MYLGIGLVVLSMFFFSLLYAFFKACTPFLSNTQIIFIQSVFSWLLLSPILVRKGPKYLKTHHFWRISLRTVFGLLSMVCITVALKTAALAEVVLLNNTAPLFVPVLIWGLYREKISAYLGLSLLIGFVGVFILLGPSFGTLQPGMIYGVLSGLLSACLLIVTRQIAGEHFMRILFYYYLLWWILTGPFAASTWEAVPTNAWMMLFGAAIVSIAAQFTFTAALRYASSQEVAPFIYTNVIFSALIGWVVWDEVISPVSMIGMGLVILGGISTLILARKKKA
ncbi:MAG: DMT family transporter [Parachlamydiales bacterium]|nr:DMT family transporter [Parachlamydiales bacterium]